MTATTFTRVEVAEKLGISEARVRQLLAVVSERIEDTTADNRITEAGFNAIVSYREMGRSAWLNAHPIAPVEAPAPQPEPAAVYEMADRPGHELSSQTQSTQPAFTPVTDVALAPVASVPQFTVITGGLSVVPTCPTVPTAAPIVPMGQVGGQILQTTASAQAATQAVGQMIAALKQRMSVGADVLFAQDVQSAQTIESLETELAELQAMAAEYDRASRVQSVRENMRADRVGKLTAQMGQTAARLGFQLQPLSS